jgi:hypothetical protein
MLTAAFLLSISSKTPWSVEYLWIGSILAPNSRFNSMQSISSARAQAAAKLS